MPYILAREFVSSLKSLAAAKGKILSCSAHLWSIGCTRLYTGDMLRCSFLSGSLVMRYDRRRTHDLTAAHWVDCYSFKDCLHVQNELAILEFIHCLVETLDRHFGNVCELDLMFNMEIVSCLLRGSSLNPSNVPSNAKYYFHKGKKQWGAGHPLNPLVLGVLSETSCVAVMQSEMLMQAHYILDEMLMNGAITETNKQNILAPIQLLEKAA